MVRVWPRGCAAALERLLATSRSSADLRSVGADGRPPVSDDGQDHFLIPVMRQSGTVSSTGVIRVVCFMGTYVVALKAQFGTLGSMGW